MEAEPIRVKPPWRQVEDPVSHCLDGESLLLTGFPGTSKSSQEDRRSFPPAPGSNRATPGIKPGEPRNQTGWAPGCKSTPVFS